MPPRRNRRHQNRPIERYTYNLSPSDFTFRDEDEDEDYEVELYTGTVTVNANGRSQQFDIRPNSTIPSGTDLSNIILIPDDTVLNEGAIWPVNLVGANLSGVNLSGANICGESRLDRANLSGANLSGANLSSVTLDGANLSGANLSGANLSGADLNNITNFSGANLTDITVSYMTYFNGTDMTGVIWPTWYLALRNIGIRLTQAQIRQLAANNRIPAGYQISANTRNRESDLDGSVDVGRINLSDDEGFTVVLTPADRDFIAGLNLSNISNLEQLVDENNPVFESIIRYVHETYRGLNNFQKESIASEIAGEVMMRFEHEQRNRAARSGGMRNRIRSSKRMRSSSSIKKTTRKGKHNKKYTNKKRRNRNVKNGRKTFRR